LIGIAVNGLLAKICGDIRKPNDQYFLEPSIPEIKAFMNSLLIRKVCGIGAVTEQMLKGLEIHTCGDLFDKRGIVHLLFKPATASFLLSVSLGLGNSFFSRDGGESDERKSVSCERTFQGTCDKKFLEELCREICSELQEDLERKGVRGKTITLKIKTVNFEVKTRAKSISHYTSSAETIFDSAWTIYSSYLKEFGQGLKLRLMGVRISNLETKTDQVGENSENRQKTIAEMFAKIQDNARETMVKCPICEEELSSGKELDGHIDECLSLEEEGVGDFELDEQVEEESRKVTILCPVCKGRIEFSSKDQVEEKMNSHIDECLNKVTIKELVRETNAASSSKRPLTDSKTLGSSKKRICVGPMDSYLKSKT